jgi:virulence-associated protein VapD
MFAHFRKPAEWLKDETVKDIESPYQDSITKFAKVGFVWAFGSIFVFNGFNNICFAEAEA